MRSTVSGNRADRDGGGIAQYQLATVTLNNSTVSGNRAGDGPGNNHGGGLYDSGGGSFLIYDSTVTGNTATGTSGGGMYLRGTDLVIHRSLVAGNISTAAGGFNEVANFVTGLSTLSLSNNLFGHQGETNAQAFSASFAPGVTDINATSDGTAGILLPTVLTDILDTTLTSNGGPTQTHALPSGSPAIDAAGSVCSATDQRGVNRPQGAACDIGAFELAAAAPPPTVTLSINPASIAEAAGVATVTATLSAAATQTIIVNLAYTGTGIDGTDYTAGSTITIAPGLLSSSTNITAIQDSLDENDETVIVDILSVTNGTESGVQQVTTTILDDDDAPGPVLVTARFTAAPSGQSTDSTPVTEGAAGVFSFTSRFCNTSAQTVTNAFSRTRVISPGKSLISRTRNAPSGAPGGVGSEQDFSDTSLTPSECVNVLYRIGLDTRTPFTFRVDLLGNVVTP